MHTIDLSAADYSGGFNISERDGDMSVSSFAKANGGRAYPRTRSAEHTTDCLVTRADGTRYRIARNGYRPPNARKRASVTTVRTVAAPETTRVVSSYDARHAVGY